MCEIWFDSFGGACKPFYKDDVLGVICLVNAYSIWTSNDPQVDIGELWTFLGGHKEVLIQPIKEVLEEVGAVVCTHRVICGASKY